MPRTVAMGEGEACLVTRNDPMHDSVPYLFNDLAGETDILHEYFVPRGAYNAFIAGAREIMRNQPLPVLNASIRVVHQEDIALTYAPEPAFSLVLYINQRRRCRGQRADAQADARYDRSDRQAWRPLLPALSAALHGAQLLASYPELPAFLAKKRAFDPTELFGSTFYRALTSLAGVD